MEYDSLWDVVLNDLFKEDEMNGMGSFEKCVCKFEYRLLSTAAGKIGNDQCKFHNDCRQDHLNQVEEKLSHTDDLLQNLFDAESISSEIV